MSMYRLAAAVMALAMFCLPALAQEDAIGIPGPVQFDGTPFVLAWTSHPTEALYKQEYLPEGETVERYSQMFMIDVMTDGVTPADAAANMIAGLEQRKDQDPLVNHDLLENKATGELLLDFLISDDSTGETIVEWNAYRYVPQGEGYVLYAISRRGYGESEDFIAGMADWREAAVGTLATMELPAVQLD